MAQYRQSGGGGGGAFDRLPNADVDTHVIGIRAPINKQSRHRRSTHNPKRPLSILFLVFLFSIAFILTFFFAFHYLSQDVVDGTDDNEGDEGTGDTDFLANVTRIKKANVKFGHGVVGRGRDSRDWDRDDRRRDDDYDEDLADNVNVGGVKGKLRGKMHTVENVVGGEGLRKKGAGLYNEAGRDELKMYEAEYEASMKKAARSGEDVEVESKGVNDVNSGKSYDTVLADEYDDGMAIESLDDHVKDYDEEDNGKHSEKTSNVVMSRDLDDEEEQSSEINGAEIKLLGDDQDGDDTVIESADNGFSSITEKMKNPSPVKSTKSSSSEKRTDLKKKSKRRKLTGCDMKLLNSTAQLVEPVESKKFVRFSLQYTALEEVPKGNVHWEPRFAGHQSLEEREASFLARDQTINCGFVKSPKGYPSTGFDISEDDTRYISTCHIAVISCIFGNSDNLRTPTGKTVTRLSKKNVCFVMFVDEVTMQTLSAEGHTPDSGYIGLWKVVIVKNLPYTDMRRVGKVPKFLAHRLFPAARYSIWLDSKLRLQRDPLLILEYFLWRKGFEYAISNHYDRHCVWEEVVQNKKLNKFNHTIIDQQFAFYQADGLKRFNASDPNKLLPSNVPEGSFIVRAHTPMSNLFSCLWFNEVDRFTPRDQLSFAYTYHKLRWMNPGKPFNLNTFKDCERRVVSKLFRHRAEDKRNLPQ